MENWLNNVTDEQIISFIGAEEQKFHQNIIIKRLKDDIIQVDIKREGPDYSEAYIIDIKTYYFNSYGEGFIYKGFLLKPFNNTTLKWFNMVYNANINKTIDGVSYVDDFKQKHEKAIAQYAELEKNMLDSQIRKLNDLKLSKDKQAEQKIVDLNQKIKESIISQCHVQRKSSNSKGLIAKSIDLITSNKENSTNSNNYKSESSDQIHPNRELTT